MSGALPSFSSVWASGLGDAAYAHGLELQGGGVGADLADAVVEDVGDEQRALVVEREGVGAVEAGLVGGAGVAGDGLARIACDGGDDAGFGADFADAIVAGIGDVKVAGYVDGDARGDVQLGLGGGTVVAPVGCFAGADDRCDCA